MKMLNIDSLTKEESRELVIFGKAYPVEPMTVENFILTTKAAEQLVDASIAEQLSATVDMVMRSVPTVDRSVLQKLSLEQLQAIVAFVRGDDLAEEAAAGQSKAEGEEGKQ